MSRFLVDISTIPGVYTEHFDQFLTLIEDTIKQTLCSDGKKFKVLGENKFLAVVESEDTLKRLLSEVNKNSKNLVSIRSIPIRTEEEFAKNVLKVDPAWCEVKLDPFKPNEKIFYTRITTGYPGYSQDEYFEVHKKDAIAGLAMRLNGALNYWSFKGIPGRTYYSFLASETGGEMDDALVAIPMARSRMTSNDLLFHDIIQVELF